MRLTLNTSGFVAIVAFCSRAFIGYNSTGNATHCWGTHLIDYCK